MPRPRMLTRYPADDLMSDAQMMADMISRPRGPVTDEDIQRRIREKNAKKTSGAVNLKPRLKRERDTANKDENEDDLPVTKKPRDYKHRPSGEESPLPTSPLSHPSVSDDAADRDDAPGGDDAPNGGGAPDGGDGAPNQDGQPPAQEDDTKSGHEDDKQPEEDEERVWKQCTQMTKPYNKLVGRGERTKKKRVLAPSHQCENWTFSRNGLCHRHDETEAEP